MKAPDPEKLNTFLGKLVGDLGASASAALVLLGDRLGIYKAMADGKAVTPEDLAEKTKLNARYLREWLSAQAAAGYIDYNPKSKKFKLNPEQACAFADTEDDRHLFRDRDRQEPEEKHFADDLRIGAEARGQIAQPLDEPLHDPLRRDARGVLVGH
jgi:hypothetical protein